MSAALRAVSWLKHDRLWTFWGGCLLVTLGVGLHLPMYWMGRDMGFRLTGMAMDGGMIAGMGLILIGIALTALGLRPRHTVQDLSAEPLVLVENAPLTRAHWSLMTLLAVALVIDVMKPASLGFVVPGMREEYGIGGGTAALLPLAALTGTVLGSLIWGWLADVFGRRASILLSSVMFIGTSICGAMPDFGWNIAMCLLMGMAAGGLLPVAYALLAELVPTRHRGWSLVLVGGIGTIGGYFAASALSAWLQPDWGWRVMWLLNLPTGLLLIALSPLLPESARFLQHLGLADQARASLERFGMVQATSAKPKPDDRPVPLPQTTPPNRNLGLGAALTLTALCWGLVNFGLLLWLPDSLVSEGRNVEAASGLIARSTVIAAPTVVLCAWLYGFWSARGAFLVMLTVMTLGLTGLFLRSLGVSLLADPVAPLALLIVGSSGVISILLPHAAESYPSRVRGRAAGWVAACSKLGGLLAQGLTVATLVPSFGFAAAVIGVPTLIALGLVAVFARETRGRDLADLESSR